MDASFVKIGKSIECVEGVKTDLGFLYDANNATYLIESDGNVRLLHLLLKKLPEGLNAPWSCTLENARVSTLAPIYVKGESASPQYDPPRITNQSGLLLYNRPYGMEETLDVGMGAIYIRPTDKWGEYYVPGILVPGSIPGQGSQNNFALWGSSKYRFYQTQEVGTYIIPICYHTTDDDGFKPIQVLRSDASFWPMSTHTTYSHQDPIEWLGVDPVPGRESSRDPLEFP